MAFRGTHDHNLDAKNRLTVPSRLRTELGERVVVAKGVDDCLALWPHAAYDEMVETALGRLNPLSPETRRMKRFFNSQAHTADLDSAGRVMIPAFLMEAGKLGREVIISGAGECLEIWDRAAWAAEEAAMAAGIDGLTANLGHAG